jgi:predicted acylesterase/phospholipase RssA/CRP-like cAMP-binding protein
MMDDLTAFVRCGLFSGIEVGSLAQIAERSRARHFDPGEALCRAGDAGERCWVITAGLVDVLGPIGASSTGEVLGRLRKGATVGETALILGEPHRESVVASIPTSTLELDAGAFAEMVARYPVIVTNALRAQHGRLLSARERTAEREVGETVALAAGPSLRGAVARLVAAAGMVSPRPVTSLNRDFSFAGALTAAHDLVTAHGLVLIPAELSAETLEPLLRESDRVVALVGSAEDSATLGTLRRTPGVDAEIEVVLVGAAAHAAGGDWSPDAPLRVIRHCAEVGPQHQPLPAGDIAWLARHLTRTKLGLALGAGGAKGYAHIGTLQVLQEAGYVVDCVAGSSIGAIVGSYLALGADAAEIDATLRAAFDPATVAEIFKIAFSGRASGLDAMTRLLQETTRMATFADTRIPLTIMAADLVERAPAPLRDGPLWEALLAATALAGFFRPYERGGHRYVDGLALVPVPTGAVVEDGADVTVAVNLMGRETLESWPEAEPPESPEGRRRPGMLDDLLGVMDLSQLNESVRHAELADIAVTPRFGPGEWRDFHLADQFLTAGRTAAEEGLPALRSLALPASGHSHINHEGEAGHEPADAIRI